MSSVMVILKVDGIVVCILVPWILLCGARNIGVGVY